MVRLLVNANSVWTKERNGAKGRELEWGAWRRMEADWVKRNEVTEWTLCLLPFGKMELGEEEGIEDAEGLRSSPGADDL